MKKVIIFLLIFVSITTNLLAFGGSSYKVNSDKMKLRFSSNTTTYILDLTRCIDYSCVNIINPPPPTITVTVSPNNDHLSYNQETADKLGKEYLNIFKNNFRLERTSIDSFGKNKALYAELTSSSNVIRAYLVTNEKDKDSIIVNSNKGDNFIYTDAYRNFANSFEIPNITPPPTSKKGSYRSSFDSRMNVPDDKFPMIDSRGRAHKKRREHSPLELTIIAVCVILGFIAWKIKNSLN
ncbi:MAG: hypothetical protein IKP71_05810 [Candidatus Riflebacteria bacterium]|nr:hypothetical protein [Candidatus Riflebacteria bacterium]